jgi:hypothetical protein
MNFPPDIALSHPSQKGFPVTIHMLIFPLIEGPLVPLVHFSNPTYPLCTPESKPSMFLSVYRVIP